MELSQAFERVVAEEKNRIFSYALYFLANPQDAEDITQEVFVKLARKLKTFGRKSSFRTWLYRITVNTAKDFSRKIATKKVYEAAFVSQQGLNNPSPLRDEHVEADRLYKSLDTLPEKQKTAVLLVFSEGLTHKEAAQVLSCPEATVSWRIFQAKKRLKKSLEHEI